jgi:hypothetical protein
VMSEGRLRAFSPNPMSRFLPCHGRGHYAWDCWFFRSSSLLQVGGEAARRLSS